MSPNDENEQLSTPSDKFELRKSTPSEFCRVFNLSDFGAQGVFAVIGAGTPLDIFNLRQQG